MHAGAVGAVGTASAVGGCVRADRVQGADRGEERETDDLDHHMSKSLYGRHPPINLPHVPIYIIQLI